MIFTIFQEVVQKHQKSPNFELWEASRWSVFIGFQKKSDLGYFYRYLQYILGATKYGRKKWFIDEAVKILFD